MAKLIKKGGKLNTVTKAKKSVEMFRSYHQKLKEIKMLKNHYDNSFNLKIEGVQAEVKKPMGLAGAAIATLAK